MALMSKNSAEDEVKDWRRKCLDLEGKLAQLRSELSDEKLKSGVKLEQQSLEHRQELDAIRDNFEKEKTELISRHEEKYHKLEMECSALKDQVSSSSSLCFVAVVINY